VEIILDQGETVSVRNPNTN